MLVDEPEVICIQPDSVTLQDDLQAEMYRAEHVKTQKIQTWKY